METLDKQEEAEHDCKTDVELVPEDGESEQRFCKKKPDSVI